ncbi:MAG: HAD superfamily hydrolase (TIGR01509 family) [Myxococcota bacterium]|jgi:HAD superfamily hydrolase (TIGR01509 family)
MPNLCVIFDLDGTLVDSEGLCNRAFLDLIPSLQEPIGELMLRYRGAKLAWILADIEQRTGATLPEDFVTTYRARVAELFASELEPTPGAREMLEALPYDRCIASSAPIAKITHALEVSGLLGFFHGRLYSSYEVDSWKPEPGIFLHAASAMGYDPADCVVVDDSEVGVEAADAAGMQVLWYLPEGGAARDLGFAKMSDLPARLASMTTSNN